MTKTHLLVATALAGAAACTSSSQANFAAATDDVRLGAVDAAVGDRLLGVLTQVGSIDNKANPTGCPAVAVAGTTTTVTSCRSQDEVVTGTLVLTNPPGSERFDPAAPSSLTATDFVVDPTDFAPIGLDGTYAADPGAGTRDIELTLDAAGRTVTHLHLSCDTDDLCTALAGSEIATGLGAAAVEGTFQFGKAREEWRGNLTLHGADDLAVGNLAPDDQGCVTYHVSDGDTGTWCN